MLPGVSRMERQMPSVSRWLAEGHIQRLGHDLDGQNYEKVRGREVEHVFDLHSCLFTGSRNTNVE
jgi:hypothetical protein